MHVRSLFTVAAFLTIAGSLSAQGIPRRATLRNPDNDGRGRCPAVVMVDGAAEIDIRGDTAFLRDLSGAPAQWRRFDCTGPVPSNPVNFRFDGVDGRGRQTLIRDPRDGRGVVVRIEDPQGGAGEYKFDIAWDARAGDDFGRGDGRGDRYRGMPRRFSADDAVRACQDAVTQQASDRFRTSNLAFRRIGLDNDRRDLVTGMFEVRRGDRDERFQFSCSVDFEASRIRSVQIDPMGRDRDRPGYAPEGNTRAVQSCQRAVEARMRQDGYGRIEFVSINADNRPGRSEWIVGGVRADSRDGSRSFEFSCSVDPRDGDVRSVDVRSR